MSAQPIRGHAPSRERARHRREVSLDPVAVTRRSGLYRGHITHVRFEPFEHRFRYPSYLWLIDLDELTDLDRRLRLFAVERTGLTSLHAGDYMAGAGGRLKQGVEDWLAARGIHTHGGRIELLTNTRVFGYQFNPLSVFWCYRPDGSLAATIAEVHNTYGDRHRYLLDLDTSGRATAVKEFYVSPFFDLDGEYDLRLPPPGQQLDARIDLRQGGGRVFTATLRGQREPLDDRRLAGMLLRLPFVTLQTAALIRWQGIRLWLRGLAVRERPPGGVRSLRDDEGT